MEAPFPSGSGKAEQDIGVLSSTEVNDSSTTSAAAAVEQAQSITVDYCPGDNAAEPADDLLTITTTFECGASEGDNNNASLEVSPLKETNLNTADVAGPSVASTLAAVESFGSTKAGSSLAEDSSTVKIIPQHASERGIESQTMSSSYPDFSSSPAVSRAAQKQPKTHRDKENLHELLRFVAATEKAKLNNQESFSKDYIFEVRFLVIRSVFLCVFYCVTITQSTWLLDFSCTVGAQRLHQLVLIL